MLIIWLSIDITDNQLSIHLLRPQSLLFVNSYLMPTCSATASFTCLPAVKLDKSSKIILIKIALRLQETTLVYGDRYLDPE